MHFYQILKGLGHILISDQDTFSNHNKGPKRKLGCNVENCITCYDNNDQICYQCNATYTNSNGLCKYTEKDSSDYGFFSDKNNIVIIIAIGTIIVVCIILCLIS